MINVELHGINSAQYDIASNMLEKVLFFNVARLLLPELNSFHNYFLYKETSILREQLS